MTFQLKGLQQGDGRLPHSLSDNGAYTALPERNAAFSLLRNYLTTTSETQGAQGSAVAAGHINGWDRPLLPRDDRPPAAGETPPFWDKNPIEMRDINTAGPVDVTGGKASSSKAPPPKAMRKRPQPKAVPGAKAPKTPPGPTGTPYTSPRPKSRPTPPGEASDWVIAALPQGIVGAVAVHKDYADTNVRTRHWKSADETQYTLSVIQGPAAASHTGTAWAQFLRRVTTCMCFRVLSAQLVTNDAACKIPEDEWLRMYPYITRKCDPAKSGSYMTAAAMLVMLGRNDK